MRFSDMGRFLTTLEGRKNLLWFSESFDMLVLPDARNMEEGTMLRRVFNRGVRVQGRGRW